MSEAPKTVEEPVVAPTTETPAVVEPTTEVAKPAETVEPVTETPAPATTEVAKEEEVAAPVKEEIKPVEEGVLGYKGPGLLKSFIFQKKFFWFGTDAVEPKALGSYLRGEKDTEAANHNAAWASKTGNGLLFFSKKATDKASPAGIFNLSDVSNIANEGTVEFHFTSGGHKHTFQAGHLAERDNWVAVLKAKVEEAKTVGETIKESEEYKKSHSALTKPAVVAAAVPAAKKVEEEKKEEKKEEKAEAKEEKKEEKAEAKEEKKEEKKARKSRSASRKRVSIFGGFGKKEEKVAEPKEETVVAPVVPATEESAVEATPAATETPAVVEPVVPAAEEPVSPTTEAAKPTPTKRNSIFGTLKSQFSQHKEKKVEEAPVVPAKDTTEPEPVSETAPVIPQVESTEPLATSVEAAAPAEVAPVTNGETKAAETPVVKSDKRKSSLPWLTKKEKPTSDEEGEKEKPKSPFAKLRATVKGKSSPKTEKVEKASEAKKEEETEAAPAEPAAPATEEPIVAAPVPAVATTPQVTASA